MFWTGLASQAIGIPISTQTTQPGAGGGVGPLSQALQTGLTAYGLGSIFEVSNDLKRPSFRRGGNAGIASLRTGFANGNPRFVNLGGSNPKPTTRGTRTVPLQTVARNF